MDNVIDDFSKRTAKTSVNSHSILYNTREKILWLFYVFNNNNDVFSVNFKETYRNKISDKFGASWINFSCLVTKKQMKLSKRIQELMSSNNLSSMRSL
jgi:hypothetical protein